MTSTAIVTGAAGGIGRAIATALAAGGYRLFLCDINRANVEDLARTLSAAGADVIADHIDIASPDSARGVAEQALAKFGRIDALVHAAGIDAPRGKLWLEDDQHWRTIIDVDLSGAWWCAKAVLPTMIEQQSGRIVFIGSVAARVATHGTSAAYNAAKSGINGLAIGLSAQTENLGIRVNVVSPGPTGTGAAMAKTERQAYQAIYPLGEGGTRPVVEACLYLLGPGGDWISGTVLNVSGGRFRG